MATIIDIADAVVTALNGPGASGFSQQFTAARMYLPVFDLADMKTLRVTVVPKGTEMSMAGRGMAQSDVQIDVAVQKKLGQSGGNAEIDALMGLVEEIAEFIRSTGRFGSAAWVRTENLPIYSQEHLGQFNQFTSLLTLTFRVLEGT